MSSEAEELAPADAVGSVSGTDGNSGSTKLSTVLGAPAFGLGEASGLGSGPGTNAAGSLSALGSSMDSYVGGFAGIGGGWMLVKGW